MQEEIILVAFSPSGVFLPLKLRIYEGQVHTPDERG